MRIYSSAFFASALILAHTTNPSARSTSKLSEVDHPANNGTSDGGIKDTNAFSVLNADDDKTAEERMQPPIIQKYVEAIASASTSVNPEKSREIARFLKRHELESAEPSQRPRFERLIIDHLDEVMNSFRKNKNVNPVLIEQLDALTPEARSERLTRLIEDAIFDKDLGPFFKKLSDNSLPNPFELANLEQLKKAIKAFNQEHHSSVTVKDVIFKGFDDVDLLYLLSQQRSKSTLAKAMELDLFVALSRAHATIDDFANMLKIPNNGVPSPKLMDTLAGYILHRGKAAFDSSTEIVTLLTSRRFDKHVGALLIRRVQKEDPTLFDALEKKLFQSWVTEGVTPENIGSKIFANANTADEEAVESITSRFANYLHPPI